MNLFINEPFTSHAGLFLDWKIECDALTDADLETIAAIVARRCIFGNVIGIPRGGLRLAEVLKPYCNRLSNVVLLVDDVLTTGSSMIAERASLGSGYETIGFVIFARGECPEWIMPLFWLSEVFQ